MGVTVPSADGVFRGVGMGLNPWETFWIWRVNLGFHRTVTGGRNGWDKRM